MKKVAIINYGAGNLASLINAVDYLGYNTVVLDRPKKNYDFSHIILPGVGNFGKLSDNLNKLGFNDYLIKNREVGNYIFGICVGMQLLFKSSDESKNSKGLNFFEGNFKLFNFKKTNNLPIPHIGFNSVEHKSTEIWKNVPNKSFFYFIHSFRINSIDKNFVTGITNYGQKFTSFIEKNNIFGSQFHPEKSHKNGLTLLSNFLKLK